MDSTSWGFPPHFLLGVEPRYCHVLSTCSQPRRHCMCMHRLFCGLTPQPHCNGVLALSHSSPCHYPNTAHDFLIIFFALSSHELLGTQSSGPCLLCSALSMGNFPLSKPNFICSHTGYLVSATTPPAMNYPPTPTHRSCGVGILLEEHFWKTRDLDEAVGKGQIPKPL